LIIAFLWDGELPGRYYKLTKMPITTIKEINARNLWRAPSSITAGPLEECAMEEMI
jgi:hypothetical protein